MKYGARTRGFGFSLLSPFCPFSLARPPPAPLRVECLFQSAWVCDALNSLQAAGHDDLTACNARLPLLHSMLCSRSWRGFLNA